MIWLIPILGAFLNRWHGGGFFKAPRWLKQACWALPFVFTTDWWPIAVLAFTASFWGQATGHGRGQSLKEPLKGDPEKVEILTLWAQKYLSVYWYKVLILSVCGVAMALGGVIGSLLTGHWFVGLSFLLAGAFSPPAYMLGYKIYPNQYGGKIPFLNKATEIGEFGTGLIIFLPFLLL